MTLCLTLLELTDDETKAIIDPALRKIPNPRQILNETLVALPQKKLQPSYVKSHFSESLVLVASSTYAKFQVYQKNAAGLVADSFISKYSKQMNGATLSNNRQFIQSILETFMPLAVNFEKRTSQMRRSRAGTTFEYVVVDMLEKSGIKCERTARSPLKKLNRMDVVIPDKETAMKSPDKAIFLSCKHTLRERWKQALPDKNRNWIMYLVTLDDNIPDKKAKEINEHNLVVYIRDELKAESHLAKKDWIRKLSDLPNDLRR
jgi:hypothetical protein